MEYVPAGTIGALAETGERSEVLATPLETGDRYQIRLTFAARASGPERHSHPGLTEAFTVREGMVGFQVGSHRSAVGPGDRREVPPGTVHALWNTDDRVAVIDVDIIFAPPGPRPGADLVRFGTLYEELVAGGNRPGPLQLAVLLDDYAEAFALPVPATLQASIRRPLAAIGRARGYQFVGRTR